MLAVLALLLTGLRFAVLNEDRFVTGAGNALTSEPVSSAIGSQLTRQLVLAHPDLITFEPLLDSGMTAVVRSGAARSAVEAAARQLYRTAVAGDADTAVLRLGNVGLLAVQSARTLSPDVAERIPKSVDNALVSLEGGDAAEVISAVTETAHLIRLISWIVTGLAVLALLAAVLVRQDRTAAGRRIALTLSAAGVLGIALHFLIRGAVVDLVTTSSSRDAGFAVYDAFLDDTVAIGVGTIGLGLLIVVAIGALGRRVSLTTSVRLRWAATRESPRGRRVAGAGAAALGLLVLVDPDSAWRLLVPVAGLALMVVGLETLLRTTSFAEERAIVEAAADADAGRDDDAEPVEESPEDRRDRRRKLAWRGALAAVVLIVGLVAIGSSVDDSLRPVKSTTAAETCNGSDDYCDLRLDEITLPSTHNSYSSARDGFLLAEQQEGVGVQLQKGIRGLLIDSYLANPTPDGRVYTRLDLSPNSRAKIEDSIGPAAMQTALRLRSQIGSDVDESQTPSLYFCHGFCELGAVSGDVLLGELRDFMLSHPREVVVVSVEDQVPPEQFAKFVEQAGLLDMTWKGSVDPLPTLREMIDSGGRILWMAEKDAGDVPWYHQQFDLVQETPYDKATLKELLSDAGCAPNRGNADNPLFLLNHNVSTVPPRASFAETVNARQTILQQVARCKKIRHRTPNLIAVDFFATGDVVGASNELNDRAVAAKHGDEDKDASKSKDADKVKDADKDKDASKSKDAAGDDTAAAATTPKKAADPD